jgi:hypothetical protein
MSETYVLSELLARTALTLSLVTLFPAFSCAQDFQIMVHGPWDYVLDPNPGYDTNSPTPGEERVILIAPSGGHNAYIFPGPDARKVSNKINPNANGNLALYYVDFNSSQQNAPISEPNEEPAQLYFPTQTVSDATINSVLYSPSTTRYAISLPMPDYINTYTGSYGTGFAQSKIRIGRITNKTPAADYTYWMVLHYSVSSIPATMQLSRLVQQGVAIVLENPINVTTADGRTGISIAVMPPDPMSDLVCDPLSGLSFANSVKMWGLDEHVRFPEQYDQKGTQQPGYYDYSCPEGHRLNLDSLSKRVNEIEHQKQKISNADIPPLRDDLGQLLNIQVGTHKGAERDLSSLRKDCLERLNVLQGDLHLMLGHLPEGVADALSCTRDFISDVHTSALCPSDKHLIDAYFGQNGAITSAGSTDCHKGQISINDAFRDIE